MKKMKFAAALGLSLTLVACGNSASPTPSARPVAQPVAQTVAQPTAATPLHVIDANRAQMPDMFNRHGTRPKPYTGTAASPPSVWPAQPNRAVRGPAGPFSSQALTRTVRVYYSDPLPASSPVRDGGQFHAIMLSNLLGQYSNVRVIRAPISQYRAGDALNSERTFYIGTVWGEALPPAFLSDVQSGAPVTWMGYNLWELGDGLSKLGLNYVGLHTALTDAEIAATFSTVNYKNYAYHKYPAQQEMNEITVDPARTQTLATAQDAAGDQIPYLVRSGKFYVVADNPFQYITTTDRYLVMADSLKTMLNDTQTGSCRKQAVLRLEDVSAMNDPSGLRKTLDVIQELRVPFAMTVIPQTYYGGQAYNWTGNIGQLFQVYRAVSMGGTVIQHGYTHNYHGLREPEGDSGDEWEFWDRENNMPLSKLTPQVAQQRIVAGRLKLLGLGLVPTMWTTPHYEADVSLYPAITQIYPTVIERRMYAADGVRGGQFFPYPVRDQYGTLVLPEDLGNPQPGYMTDAVLEAAEANKNLSCSYASFFVHPYLLEDDYDGVDKFSKASFKAMIQAIQAKGFTFVSPQDLTTRTLQ